MTALIRPVILSGGTGTRLWPVSREGMAKQLLPLTDDLTMLEKTLTRVVGAKGFGAPIIIGSHAVRFILKEQAEKVAHGAKIVLEPARRDTMAAVLLAAALVAARNEEEVLAVMPSDHMISEEEAFRAAVRTAAAKVAESGIAVIGVQPTEPATGYGYIRPGAASGEGVRAVERFVEKPDAVRAEQLISEGCLWNAGIFCFRAGWLIEAMRAMMPEDVARIELAVKAMREDLGMFIPGPSFAEVTSISFDHAFMEKTRDAHVAAAGLPFSRIRILLRLARNPMTVKEVALAATIDAPAATVAVNDLEDRGLVVREVDPNNRRSKLVSLTDAGRALVVAVNKWDAVDQYRRERIKQDIARKLNFLGFAKVHTISALKGQGIAGVLSSVDRAYAAAMAKLSTPKQIGRAHV